MTFTTHSESVARRFIRTALVVDDRAFRRDDVPDETHALTPPTGGRPAEPDPPGSSGDHPSTASQPDAARDTAHGIDTEGVIRDFASDSVFCTVVGVSETDDVESLARRVLPLAGQADVFVTDWVLFTGGPREGGGAAEIILRAVLEDENRDRFRLIVVWTGTPQLTDIASTIAGKLTGAGLDAVLSEDGFAITCGPVRIAVYAKPEANIDPATPAIGARVVNSSGLVDRAVAEYASATGGLLSNAALTALTAVRDHTQRLLVTFRPALDAPFLAHRAMLPTPEDAEAFAEKLISDELGAIVEDAGAGSETTLLRIEEMIAEKPLNYAGLFVDGNVPDGTDMATTAVALLRHGASRALEKPELTGLGGSNRREKFTKEPHRLGFSASFSRAEGSTDVDAGDLDREFAALSSMRTRYQTADPILTAGVIVRFKAPAGEAEAAEPGLPNYGLCVQPVCDSIRLAGTVKFPFLPLTLVAQTNPGTQPKFSFVVPEGSKYIYLKASFSPRDLHLPEFAVPAGRDRMVFARDPVTGIRTVTTVSGWCCEYSAELKDVQTVRALAQFSQQAGRPGLDESEWLRRSTT